MVVSTKSNSALRRRCILVLTCLLAWSIGSSHATKRSGRSSSASSKYLATTVSSTTATELANSAAKTTVELATSAASTTASASRALLHQADKTFSRIAAGKLTQSLSHQNVDTEWHTPKAHAHRKYLKHTFAKVLVPNQPQPGSLTYAIRVGIAGGIAGASGTLALYPMDSAKTLRQSQPSLYKNVRQALASLVRDNGQWHIGRAYCGVIPATLGAIPSSALYFGAYETMKSIVRKSGVADTNKRSGRLIVHALSAASGNMLSSAVFVPKEVIKQHMQYGGGWEMGKVIQDLVRTKGIRGIYCGYSATLMRNIPSAVLRFSIYEELKHIFVIEDDKERKKGGFNWKIFLAGAASGTISSVMMTPVDVIKTRMATGTCPVNMAGCVQHVIQEGGVMSLYMGAGSRVVWSTAFAAIGFGMLETAKGWMGVSDLQYVPSETEKQPKSKEWKIFSRHQRTLEHAVSDRYE